jgi:exopolysaccharide biosynthesis polyprenyl glycosylphosphotransferase
MDDASPALQNIYTRDLRLTPFTTATPLTAATTAGAAHSPDATSAPPLTLPLRRARPLRPSRVAWLLDGAGWNWTRPISDLLLLSAAVMWTIRWPGSPPIALSDAWPLLLLPPGAMLLLLARGMYRKRMRTFVLDGIAPMVGAISIAVMAVVMIGIYEGGDRLAPSVPAHLWLLALAGTGGGRIALLVLQRQARARGLIGRATLIVGAGNVGMRVARRLVESPQYGLRPVGFLDSDPLAPAHAGDREVPVLGRPADLEWIASMTGASHIVLAFSADADQTLVPLARRCEELGLEVSLVPRLFESVNDRFQYESLGGLPLLALRSTDPKGWQFTVKHACDRLIAAILLTMCAPLLAAIAAAVRLESPGPIVFRQRRVGRDGHEFDVFKFRSMRLPPAGGGEFKPRRGDAPGGVEGTDRRTRIGRLLRRTSLDELPQLFNVLRGDMSLVGPRPERPEFVDLFKRDLDRYGDRHRVKSGITGWAQVNGLRGQTSLADRVEWDNYYIEHWSLPFDAKILVLTAVAVFKAAE